MVGARKQVRGDQLVAKVLRATLAEIGLVGVDGLSIEAVAERAHVNKTTIYRRWPAPEDLAQAALSFAAGAGRPAPDTGSLRGDLRAFVHEFQSAATLPEMRTIMRLRWSGTSKGPLAACTRQIQEKKRSGSSCCVARCRAASCRPARISIWPTTSWLGPSSTSLSSARSEAAERGWTAPSSSCSAGYCTPRVCMRRASAGRTSARISRRRVS